MATVIVQLNSSLILARRLVNGVFFKISQAEECIAGLVENQVIANFVLLNLREKQTYYSDYTAQYNTRKWSLVFLNILDVQKGMDMLQRLL